TSPTDGWLAGTAGIGRWTSAPPPSPLVVWPQPNRNPLTSVAAPPAATLDLQSSGAVAVGLGGAALRYDPATGWLTTPVPPRASHVNLSGVAFAGPTTAFAVGQFGTIIRWDGTSWTEDTQSVSLTQAQLNAVAFGTNGEGYAVGTFGTILHFDGTSWTIEQPP